MYKILDNATADVAFIVEADTIEKLFEDAAKATSEVMVELETIKENVKVEFQAKGKDEEEMLFNFLQEIIFIKDAELKVFKKFEIKIEENKVFCKAQGDLLNNENQKHGVDVKAVTYHKFKVYNDGKWKCHVILDI